HILFAPCFIASCSRSKACLFGAIKVRSDSGRRTMAATPPPRGRIHTPPTPLHGPKYDSYEPYSPRPSSRLAAQHSNQVLQSPQQHRTARVSTPRSSRALRTTRKPNSSISPPSSPPSPSAGSLRLAKPRKAAPNASRQQGIGFDDFVADFGKTQ